MEEVGKGRLAPELSDLWVEFKPSLLQQVKTIEEAVRAASAQSLSDQVRENAKREAHKLAGSIGSFGCLEGSQLARDSERLLSAGSIGGKEAQQLSELTARLRLQVETFH